MEEALTREFFMQNTGVYSTHSNFALIKLEFEESNLSQDAFCEKWVKEEPLRIINLSEKITVSLFDDVISLLGDENKEEDEDITAIDVIESLSESEFYWKSKCEELYKGYKEAVDALSKSQSLLEEMKTNNNNLMAVSKELCTCITDNGNGRKRKFNQHILPQ